MATRWRPGPVFEFESLMAARRWQIYAGRAVLVAGLLASLALVWLTQYVGRGVHSVHEVAQIGQAFYVAIMGVELVLVLMVAPAATAGAICHDRARGGLTHLLVTDLSDAEIVLGKLAAQLATILGIVACALPVLVIASLLGGVDPDAVLVGSLVIVGVAVLGVSVALAFSVWASKAHEVLVATYAVWAVWLLASVACPRGRAADALMWTNPFFLLFDGRNYGRGRVLCSWPLAWRSRHSWRRLRRSAPARSRSAGPDAPRPDGRASRSGAGTCCPDGRSSASIATRSSGASGIAGGRRPGAARSGGSTPRWRRPSPRCLSSTITPRRAPTASRSRSGCCW